MSRRKGEGGRRQTGKRRGREKKGRWKGRWERDKERRKDWVGKVRVCLLFIQLLATGLLTVAVSQRFVFIYRNAA